MLRISKIALLTLLAAVIFSACNRMPDYAGYIPKDAVAVAGINLKSLSKKIAWNMITGSKLFKEMQDRMPEKNAKDAMSGIEKAGINPMSTFYVYMKSDNRYKGGNRVTGLVPLSDMAAWEAYIRQVFPKVEIKQNGDHKEASLGSDMYVGWNSNLLIIINVMTEKGITADGAEIKAAPDMVAVAGEMAAAFNVPKENPISSNAQFTKLESEGHDVTFWLNYEQLMVQYSGDMADKMGGVSLSKALWKDAAFTCGFDFKKGKITGDVRYYMGDALKDIGKEFGSENADKDMLSRLPGQNLDVIMAMHLSPKGIKSALEKTNMLGLANVGLTAQGFSVDEVLDAFTGDMAIVMNDFSLKTESVTDNFMGQAVTHQNQKPMLSMSYVMKINKKENFAKLLQLAKQSGLQQLGNGFVIPIDDKDSVYIMTNGDYAVVSNKYPYATGFLEGKFKDQKMPDAAAAVVSGHPMGLFVDIQQLVSKVDAGVISNSVHDSLMITESKKLLSNISVSGGDFKESAFEYHLEVNFTNQDENSIIEIMDYAMKMNDADKAKR